MGAEPVERTQIEPDRNYRRGPLLGLSVGRESWRKSAKKNNKEVDEDVNNIC